MCFRSNQSQVVRTVVGSVLVYVVNHHIRRNLGQTKHPRHDYLMLVDVFRHLPSRVPIRLEHENIPVRIAKKTSLVVVVLNTSLSLHRIFRSSLGARIPQRLLLSEPLSPNAAPQNFLHCMKTDGEHRSYFFGRRFLRRQIHVHSLLAQLHVCQVPFRNRHL